MANNKFFHFSENKQSDKLVVIFSGVNSKNFMGYKLIKDFNCNKIFIREINKSWYHAKINNVSNNIDELIKYINQYTNRFNSSNITFIGSSMGAYASLLIGIKLNIGKIIAFGPQIIINKNFPNNPKDDSYIKYKNLSTLINNSKSNIDIFIGINELPDLYQIKNIKESNNIQIYKLFSQPHNVMLFLHKINILEKYISSKIFDKNYNLNFLNTTSVNFFKKDYLKKSVELFYIQKNYKHSKLYFEKLINSYPNINTFFKYKAICEYYIKDYVKSIETFKKAELIVYRDEQLHYYQGMSFFRLKNYLSASKHFKLALEFSIYKKISYYIKLAISLREIKQYDEALVILNQSLKISKFNYGTYYQVAQIYKSLNKIDLAINNLKIANKLKPSNELIISELARLSRCV